MKSRAWARIGREGSNYAVIISEGRSPLDPVIEVIQCSSRAAAEKALALVLKEMGRTYGGRKW